MRYAIRQTLTEKCSESVVRLPFKYKKPLLYGAVFLYSY